MYNEIVIKIMKLLKSPLSQFDVFVIYPYYGNIYDLSLSNLSLTALIVIFLNMLMVYVTFDGKLIARS
jgi:hypothetical protein